MNHFKDVVTCYMFSISSKTTNFLYKCAGLYEAYVDLTFTKDEVINSLKSVLYNIDKFNYQDVLDNLNEEMLNVGIVFLLYSNELKHINVKYPKAGIVNGKFDPESQLIYMYINDTFFKQLQLENFETLANVIIECSTHEDTHKQQIKNSNGKTRGIDINNEFKTKKEIQEYLMNFGEIDAHARETAIQLLNQNYSGVEIGQMINNRDKILLTYPSYKLYYTYFGQVYLIPKENWDKDCHFRLKIWKRFLSRIIVYLITLGKYKYTIKKSDALKYLIDLEKSLESI